MMGTSTSASYQGVCITTTCGPELWSSSEEDTATESLLSHLRAAHEGRSKSASQWEMT